MALNWIDVNGFSFHSLLLLERFQIRLLCGIDDPAFRASFARALAGHPAVAWYLAHRCPECADTVAQLIACAPHGVSPEELRSCELSVMSWVEDFITYTRPELMDTHCGFIAHWDPARLLELADFKNKTILDVGSGSGRLAFAAAGLAREVYACEPVETLRAYLRSRIRREGLNNVRVVDGMADSLPYPNDLFDIVMSGHVVGDDYDGELTELARVTKPGGWLIDCPGEETHCAPDQELLRRGWEMLSYPSHLGGQVHRYRKRVIK